MVKHETTTGPALAGAATLPPGQDPLWTHLGVRRALAVVSRLRTADHRRPWILDTVMVVLVAFAMPPELLSPGRARPPGDGLLGAGLSGGVVLALGLVLVLPVWWRRRAPTVVFTLGCAAGLVLWELGLGPTAGFALLLELYNLALRASLRMLIRALAAAAAGWVLLVVFVMPVDDPAPFLVLSIGTGVAAVALGLVVRTRRLYLAALRDRALRLEVENDQRVQLMAAAERSRVAREMHDLVGHNLSIMVNLADGGAKLALADPARAAQALRLIGESGRQAMGELRRVLGVLRGADDSQPLDPHPRLSDLEGLLNRVRSAGLSVTYRTSGDMDALEGGLQLNVFRIVQEALTNALKHAGAGATAAVTIEASATRVHVRIVNTGAGRAAEASGRSGHGVVGIRQRAALYDGKVTVGPCDDGRRWIVDVVLDPSAVDTTGGLAR